MTGALAGRCAVITGAGGGLGRAFALGFARAGARVVAADLDGGAAAATCAAVLGDIDGREAVAVTADVADEASTAEMARAALDAFGSIDALVNNAAVYAGLTRRAFDQIEVAEWDRVMAVNVRGPWSCERAAVDVARGRGRDHQRRLGDGDERLSAVGPLRRLQECPDRPLARHGPRARRDGVRVNALAPGFTLTEASRELIDDADSYGVARGAIKRSLQPEDIVGTAVFLASDAASMITGQTLVVDGGRQFL